MDNNSNPPRDEIEDLLGWLADDKEQAGEIYEQVRKGLIRFFYFRGCNDPEHLTDETINRVAGKVKTLDTSKGVKTTTYFYGFAAKILLEYKRSIANTVRSLDTDLNEERQILRIDESEYDDKHDCLEACLAELREADRILAIEYYNHEKGDKYNARKKLAAAYGCEMNALHVRVFRLRRVLLRCVNHCLEGRM